MKVLVVGAGSIGKRHITNLLAIKKVDKIVVHTKVKSRLDDLDSKGKIEFVDSLDDVNSVGFALIANETYKHIDTALLLAQRGINLFIEKPLSHNLDRVDVFKSIVRKQNIKVYVAYNMRLLGVMDYIRRWLEKKTLGDLYFAKIEVGQDLRSWRPWRDYRESYSASAKKGGGVTLDLSHELDYMRYLFGDPCFWKVIKTKAGNLEIDSDSIFEGVFQYSSGFLCNVHMDYLQNEKRRTIRIETSKGSLLADLVKKNIRITSGNREKLVEDENLFDLNKTYIDEVVNFMVSLEENKEPEITLDDGIKALMLTQDGKY